MRSSAAAFTPDRLLVVVILAILAGHAAALLGRLIGGGATQLFLGIANVKNAGLFVLVYWCLTRKRMYGALIGVVGFEILLGMSGFFADFKNVILTVFVAAIAARPRIRAVDILIVSFAAFIAVGVAIFWSAIKPEYRLFLNQGSGAQEVARPLGERLSYLLQRTSQFGADDAAMGFEALVNRHGYTEFLGLVMAYVPATRPHEGGQLTQRVVFHILVPRIVWANKPPLPHDTDVMAEYTGLPNVWGSETSISIGHLGELYIDFGYIGGLCAMLFIGYMSGYAYRKLQFNRKMPSLISAGLGMMVTLPLAYFGTAYIKLMGSFVMAVIMAFAIQRFAWPIFCQYVPAFRKIQL